MTARAPHVPDGVSSAVSTSLKDATELEVERLKSRRCEADPLDNDVLVTLDLSDEVQGDDLRRVRDATPTRELPATETLRQVDLHDAPSQIPTEPSFTDQQPPDAPSTVTGQAGAIARGARSEA